MGDHEPESQHCARGVQDQVVHVEEAVGVRVESEQTSQLRCFEQERGGHTDQKCHPPAAAEQVAKISA